MRQLDTSPDLPSAPNFVVLRFLIGAVMISFSGVWVEISHVTPTVSAFYRVFWGALLLLIPAWIKGEIKWHGTRHLLLGLLCGLFFALDLNLYHHSIIYVGPGLGTILPNFQVFILAFWGMWLLGEKPRPAVLLAMPLAMAGLFMVVEPDRVSMGSSYTLGLLCGLGAAVCYSGFLLSLRKLQADQKGASFFYVLLVVSLLTSFFLGGEVLREGGNFIIPDLQTGLALLVLAFFSQFAGWILITNALPKVRASLSGLILLLQPALAFIWDVAFFKRPTTGLNWAGLLLTLWAIYLGMKAAPSKNSK